MPIHTDHVGSAVETIILKLLRERAMYGYEIIRVVNERTQGAFAWKEGTLYPCLHRLEGEHLIASEWRDGAFGKPRKYYLLTRKGEQLADDRVKEWQNYAAAMHAVLCNPA